MVDYLLGHYQKSVLAILRAHHHLDLDHDIPPIPVNQKELLPPFFFKNDNCFSLPSLALALLLQVHF